MLLCSVGCSFHLAVDAIASPWVGGKRPLARFNRFLRSPASMANNQANSRVLMPHKASDLGTNVAGIPQFVRRSNDGIATTNGRSSPFRRKEDRGTEML